MKVTYASETGYVTFGSLKPGDCFRSPRGQRTYLKVRFCGHRDHPSQHLAVVLENGNIFPYRDDHEVIHLDAEVTVEGAYYCGRKV